MKQALKLEAINHSEHQYGKLFCGLAAEIGVKERNPFQKPWVAEITGQCQRFGLQRKFVDAHTEYSESNSAGTRGVMLYFALEVGRPHEVFAMTSWKGRDRYFAMPAEDGIRRMTREEVDEWLRASIST